MDGTNVRSQLKIVYFSYFPAQHAIGPATAIRNLARRFESKYDVTILTLNYDYKSRTRLFDAPLQDVREGSTRILYLPKNFAGMKTLFGEIGGENSCVVVNCMFDTNLAIPAILYSLLRRRPVAHIPHGIFMPAVFQQKNLKKRMFCFLFSLLRAGTSVIHIATSGREVKDIRNAIKNPAVVEISNLNELHDAIPTQGKSQGSLNICFIGRIAKQKNLLGALEILRFANVKCNMDVYGVKEDAAYFEQCQALISTLPETVKIAFMGFTPQEELLRKIGSYSLFFAPTLDENYGYSIIEALGAGVPVLISDRTPWHGLEKYKAGWAVELENLKGFSEVLHLAFNAGAEWADYQKGARTYAQEHSASKDDAEKYEMLFDAIIGCRKQPFEIPASLAPL